MFACNWTALELFLNCTTQWRYRPTGELQSLDYGSVRAVMSIMNIPRKKQLDAFWRLRCIESSAIAAMEKHRAKS